MANGSIRSNYLYNLAYQILNLLTPLITTPYVSRILSADGIGQYSFTSSVVSYFVLFATLGTTIYGQREISYYQNDRKKRSQIFWEIELLSCITVSLAIIVYIIFLAMNSFNLIYFVQIFSLIAVASDISWLFTGMEEFKVTATRNMVFKLINIFFIFMAVRSKNDLLIYIFGLCFIQFLSTLSLWPVIKDIIDFVDIKMIHPFRHVHEDLQLFIPTIAMQVYTVLDKTMIGLITNNPAENGYYEQALKITKIVMTLVTSIATVMIPRIGAYFSDNKTKEIETHMYSAYNFVWLLGVPLCFGLIGTASNFVPWFFGNGFEKSIDLIRILSILIIAIGLSNVTGLQYMIPTKKQNAFTASVCIGAIVNFSMNSALIPHWLSIGAAIGSVIAEYSVTIAQFIMIRKEISGLKVLALSPKYLFAGIVMLVALLFEDNIFTPSIWHTLIMFITGVVIYVLMLIAEKDKFFLNYSKKYLGKVLHHEI